MVRDHPQRVDELMEEIISTSSLRKETIFLIADSLYTWTAEIAEKHGILHVSLWTESATVLTINYHSELLKENGHFGIHDAARNGKNVVINYIPGVESINAKDLMSEIQCPSASPIVVDIVAKAFEQVKKADFILCNTIQELESNAVLSLNQKQATYAVGPINFYKNVPKSIIEPTPQSDCIQWLDSKPLGSVLYVSFGTIARINEHDIREITYGLLVSEVNFLWVLRTDDRNFLPRNFFDDVKDRGIVVSWCDQRRVLSSPSVGGFLTHCGWNSVLESLWGGVPMLCSPFFVDQPTNRKLVVDDWKIGIDVFDDGGNIVREAFASKVNALMKGSMGAELKENANKLRKKVRDALEEKGSSVRNFDRFVEDLKMRSATRKINGSKNN